MANIEDLKESIDELKIKIDNIVSTIGQVDDLSKQNKQNLKHQFENVNNKITLLEQKIFDWKKQILIDGGVAVFIIGSIIGMFFNFESRLTRLDEKLNGVIDYKITELEKKVESKIQPLETEINKLKDCTAEIKEPTNEAQVDGNIEVRGNIGRCTNQRIWLVVSPITTHNEQGGEIGRVEDKDCYIQGEIVERNQEFKKGTTSIVNDQQYKVYLLSIPSSDETKNQKLINAQMNNNPHIACSEISLGEYKLTMVTIDNTQSNQSNNSENTEEQTFSRATIATQYGGNWGGLQVSKDPANQSITLNGNFSGAAGYAIENDPDLSLLGGRTLTFQVRGTENSSFDAGKLFKLAVNNSAKRPTNDGRISDNDPEYITAQDGLVSFTLPDEVYKIELVFWNARLNNLQITATVS